MRHCFVILRLAVLIQYWNVTDTETHRHTTIAYTALSIASCGKNVSRDVNTPLSGTVCHPSAGTSYDQSAHQYEVSMFTLYEDMKGDEKCKNWGVLGVRGHPRSSETSPFDRAHMTSGTGLHERLT